MEHIKTAIALAAFALACIIIGWLLEAGAPFHGFEQQRLPPDWKTIPEDQPVAVFSQDCTVKVECKTGSCEAKISPCIFDLLKGVNHE